MGLRNSYFSSPVQICFSPEFCLLSQPLLSFLPDSYTLSSSLSFDIACPHAVPSSPNEDAKWFWPITSIKMVVHARCKRRRNVVWVQPWNAQMPSMAPSLISKSSLISILSNPCLPLQSLPWGLGARVLHVPASFALPQPSLYHLPVPTKGSCSSEKKWGSLFSRKMNCFLKLKVFCLKTQPCFSITFQNRRWLIQ